LTYPRMLLVTKQQHKPDRTGEGILEMVNTSYTSRICI